MGEARNRFEGGVIRRVGPCAARMDVIDGQAGMCVFEGMFARRHVHDKCSGVSPVWDISITQAKVESAFCGPATYIGFGATRKLANVEP